MRILFPWGDGKEMRKQLPLSHRICLELLNKYFALLPILIFVIVRMVQLSQQLHSRQLRQSRFVTVCMIGCRVTCPTT
jgi:hypothetical protein